MNRSHLIAALAAAATMAPGALPAQQSGDPAFLLLELETGKRVRVLAPPDTAVEGRVARVYVQSLVLDLDARDAAGVGASQWTAETTSIVAVWTRGRQTWLGAAIGGGAGAILGGLVGSVARGLCDYECGDNSDAENILVGGLFGGAAGALVGALVGTAFPRWSLQYER
ncbi:MAG: hypothetical protein P8049_10515 [Gemmatimonadota bacterium]|jgi:hypothetical protein